MKNRFLMKNFVLVIYCFRLWDLNYSPVRLLCIPGPGALLRKGVAVKLLKFIPLNLKTEYLFA